jgi:prepilin-type N-terminal cleavage/methylation domain-containing protein
MRHRTRRGFSVIEMLVVMVIAGAVGAIVLPRASKLLARNAVRSAKHQVQTTLVVARAAAIQNGRPARFVRTGNVVQAMLERGTQLTPLGTPVDLGRDKITIATANDTIRFDPRGFAFGINTASAYQAIQITRGAWSDSVCVSRFGRIAGNGGCL